MVANIMFNFLAFFDLHNAFIPYHVHTEPPDKMYKGVEVGECAKHSCLC